MKFFVAILLLVSLAWSSSEETSQEEGDRVVRPRESDEVLVNPGMGFTTFQSFNGQGARTDLKWSEGYTGETQTGKGSYPETSIAYIRIYWRILEPSQGKPEWELIDNALAKAAKHGQTLMIRLMPYGDRREEGADVPDWYRKLTGETPDQKLREEAWRIDQTKDEYAKHFGGLIRKFAEKYDGHPALESVDVSVSGPWGEGAGSSLIPEPSRKHLLGAYFDGFKRTFLVVQPWDGRTREFPAGLRLDCLGDMNGFSPTWSHMLDLYPQEIIRSGMRDAWVERPVSLEACWVMAEWEKRKFDVDYIIEQSLKWHISSFNAKSSAIPKALRPKVDRWLKKMGYRLVLRRFAFPKRVDPGGELGITSWWENKGVAPPYRDYRIAVRLRGASGSETWVTSVSIKGWLPGDQLGDTAIRLPNHLSGEYELDVGIVDPADPKATRVRLAIEGRRPDGWYAMGKLRIGPPSSPK